MIESPLIRELQAESRHKDILRVLNFRFGPIPTDVSTGLRAITEDNKLDELIDWALRCPDLDAFRSRLSPLEGAGP
jgi:hypothetical protein